jgi:Ca2+/Na+ antiporter
MMGVNKHESRNVTKKELITSALVVVIFILALVLGEIYSKTITLVVFGILFLAAIVQFYRMPKEQKSAIAKAMEEHDKTFIGRLGNIAHYAILLAVGIGIIMWIANKMK